MGYSPNRGGFRLTATSCTSESVDCRTREAREAREVRELAEDLDTALFLSAWLDFMVTKPFPAISTPAWIADRMFAKVLLCYFMVFILI